MPDITSMAALGQFVGLLAMVTCVAAFLHKRDQRLILLLVLANGLFALHFALLGAFTGAAVSVLIALRAGAAYFVKGSRAATALFLLVSAAAAAATWRSPVDIFPLISASAGTIGMFLLSGNGLRLAYVVVAVSWIIHNLAVGSIGGTIAEAIVLAANLGTMLRLARDRRRSLAATA